MTEVFTGLPEQDILLTEFFLEKFLRRHTAQQFLYDLYEFLLFPVLLLWLLSPVVRKEIIGCNVVNKTGVSVGAGWCRRV